MAETCGDCMSKPCVCGNRHSEHDPKTGQFVPDATPDEESVHITPRTHLEKLVQHWHEAKQTAEKQIGMGADADFQNAVALRVGMHAVEMLVKDISAWSARDL